MHSNILIVLDLNIYLTSVTHISQAARLRVAKTEQMNISCLLDRLDIEVGFVTPSPTPKKDCSLKNWTASQAKGRTLFKTALVPDNYVLL